MKFTDLNINTPLLNALIDLEFEEPTPIQCASFGPVMSGNDVVGIAHTGTGKTLAYLLPILRQHKFSEKKHPKVLIIVPTRELVNQVVGEIEKLCKYITIRVAGVYGGETMSTQINRIQSGLDILVATPVRAKDLANARAFKLKEIKKLVIDEVDEMFNLGFRPQLFDLLDNLPEKRQNVMFSATLNPEIEEMIHAYFYVPEIIEVASHGQTLENVAQFGFNVPNFYTKLNLLDRLLDDDKAMTRVLVFVQNKWTANATIEAMESKYADSIRVIHSNKSQNYREDSIKGFQDGTYRILVATDVIARGIDFEDVSHVVNLSVPSPESYIHRIGRTGRAGKDGVAITLVADYETESIEKIEAVTNRSIDFYNLPADLEISSKLSSDELSMEEDKQRGATKAPSLKHSKGAFHEKKLKNTKQNWEGLSKEAYKRKYGKR